MQQLKDDSDQANMDSPTGSGRGFRIVALLGIGVGVLALAALGVYGYITYLANGEDDGIDQPSGGEALGAETEDLTTPTAPLVQDEATVTPDGAAATATAACASFAGQFPGTPCPSPGQPGYDATAACVEYQEQFPGTPCP